MKVQPSKSQITLAVIAALGAVAMTAGAGSAIAHGKTQGQYVAGDFHNHSTCSDGSTSLQKKVAKSMDRNEETPWGLDWFVQAGHGGSGNRNCTLAEDASLATPAYPFLTGPTPFDVPTPTNPSPSQFVGPSTTWAQTNGAASVKGNASASSAGVPGAALSTQTNPSMWRWQSIQEFQYPLMEYLAAYRKQPLFMGVETVAPGHEHVSMSVITGQMPMALDWKPLPKTPGYTPLGNANALAQWEYCFDRNDTDWSRGNKSIADAVGNNWDCSVPGSLNSADPSWIETAKKLDHSRVNSVVTSTGTGDRGHNKTLEALKWMVANHPKGSYYVPAHLERAGPFNPNGNNGFNVEHLRNFNNAAPDVAFGFETQPGHHASDQRGEYTIRRNTISGVNVDSVGGTTYGGTGVYGAQVGGVWDALLGEGRNWWFFASSDWHNRGDFGSDDRRSTQDFYPGEYQRNFTMVRKGGDYKLRPQSIVDGLRTGNTFVASGQLIDRLAFVACAVNSKPDRDDDDGDHRFGHLGRGDDDDKRHGSWGKPDYAAKAVEALAMAAALQNTDVDFRGCATMGEKLVVKPGSDVIVSFVVRDPSGKNYSPYSFPNPSLKQIGVTQPLDRPVLDHVDVIGGMVTGKRAPGAADYAGAWPDDWIDMSNPQMLRSLDSVPAAAKNTTAKVLRTFSSADWSTGKFTQDYKRMTFRIRGVKNTQYVRLRGTNLPPSVPFETDANGNPLADLWTNAAAVRAKTSGATEYPANSLLRIPCTTTGSNVPASDVAYNSIGIDGCPNHLPVVNGQKMLAYDVAAWADLWFYSNPIFIEVKKSMMVAGVK